MSIRYKLALAAPQSVDVTLQMTMTVGEWNVIVEQVEKTFGQLGQSGASWELKRLIMGMRECVYEGNKVFQKILEAAEEKR